MRIKSNPPLRVSRRVAKLMENVISRSRAKRTLVLWCLLAFLPLAFLLSVHSAQEKGRLVILTDNVSISIPPYWRLSNQLRDSVAIYVPPRKAQIPINKEDKDEKPSFELPAEVGMLIVIERRKDHSAAVARLADIASEYPERATTLVIAGWPAIERRYRTLMPQSGEDERSSGGIETSFGTTAVAVAATVIRFNTMLAPDADPKLLDQAFTIARTLRAPEGPADVSRRELNDIQRLTRPPANVQPPAPRRGDARPPSDKGREQEGIAVQTKPGRGELEIANDGGHVVVATNGGYSFADDFGATFTSVADKPCVGVTAFCDGDPSLAVGHGGAIYYAWVGGADVTTAGDGISRSIDNGHTFPFRAMAAVCPGVTGCHVADQPHIAADRSNVAASGDDLVYNVWRENFPVHTIRISCSSDSGATWTASTVIDAGDFPRVSVGGDGFVYVAYEIGANLRLHKYNRCDAGLMPQAPVWPITVTPYAEVPCPVPGLDRCQVKNTLSSPKVAVDDLDAAHVYYAFATSTGGGNEDVMVYDSVDGGATFPRSVRVNSAIPARRFMPWISTYGGMAVVSWYDRRSATMADNDLTRFYIGGAAVRGPNLVALPESDVAGVDDPQCALWPCVAGATENATSCSHPQLAGRCRTAGGAGGSSTPCDFNAPVCPGGETCLSFGSICTKYGDYTGNAAGMGRHYSAWASATAPPGIVGAMPGINVYSSTDRIPSDFYVRDWNDSATTFDNGAQPSTHYDFWSTSDVWNQSTNIAAMPGPDGSVLGDPPTRLGPNFVYARVSRRVAAMSTAPAAMVTVNFYLGDYGMGAPFAPIGSETVTFAAGDITKITPAHAWTVPLGSVVDLCISAQIVGPDGDTFSIPGVEGIAPGPANMLITDDNNKAQRNLQALVGDGDGTEQIAMIRNGEKIKRLMQLRIKLPPEVRVRGVVDTIGGKSVEILNDDRIMLGELEPGEVRWLRFRFTTLEGIDKPTPVVIFEDNKRPSNGFTILLRRGPLEEVARRDLIAFAGVLSRLAQVEKMHEAKEQATIALLESMNVSESSYIDYLAKNRREIEEIITAHLRTTRGSDAFDLSGALKDLSNAIDEKNAGRMTVAQTAITQRLDAHLTAIMRQRSYGRQRP